MKNLWPIILLTAFSLLLLCSSRRATINGLAGSFFASNRNSVTNSCAMDSCMENNDANNRASQDIKCSDRPKTPGLGSAQNPSLRKLAAYEDMCQSFAFDQMMVFTDFPSDIETAKAKGTKIANTLAEFSQFGIGPIVIVEPVSENQNIEFKRIASGSYDPILQAYFGAIRQAGINDDQMGIWIPLPEPNLNEWGLQNYDPAVFGAAFNRFASVLAQHFPKTKLAVLLDSQTYNQKTKEYGYSPLYPFLKTINCANPLSFGLQGYPWPGENGIRNDPESFLNSFCAAENANVIGSKSIILSTGSFSLPAPENTSNPSSQRMAVMEGIANQAIKLQNKGFEVTLNIFAENKSGQEEGIDWSYGNIGDKSNPYRLLLVSSLAKLRQTGIKLSLFDTE